MFPHPGYREVVFMRCKLAWLTPVFLLSTLPAMPADVADVGARSEILVRPKIEDWRCRAGDDLRWAQPDWNDHDWVPCSSDSWSPLGISWRRLHLHLSGTAPATPWSIGTLLPAAGVLYANGQEIASSGRVGARPHYSLPIYRIIAWPSFSRPSPAEIVFATRVQHAAWTRINRGTRFLAADLELGNESTLQQRQQLYTFRNLNHSIPSSIMGLLALLLGAYVLRLWSAQPTHREYLWFVAI